MYIWSNIFILSASLPFRYHKKNFISVIYVKDVPFFDKRMLSPMYFYLQINGYMTSLHSHHLKWQMARNPVNKILMTFLCLYCSSSVKFHFFSNTFHHNKTICTIYSHILQSLNGRVRNVCMKDGLRTKNICAEIVACQLINSFLY